MAARLALCDTKFRSPPKPGWRNWQTQRTQNPPRLITSWGFDPPSRHQEESPRSTHERTSLIYAFFFGLPDSPATFNPPKATFQQRAVRAFPPSDTAFT